MPGFAIVRDTHRATLIIGGQPFDYYTDFRLRLGDHARRVTNGFSLNADAVMLPFEDAGAAPVDAADACYHGLAEFAVVSAQGTQLRGGIRFRWGGAFPTVAGWIGGLVAVKD